MLNPRGHRITVLLVVEDELTLLGLRLLLRSVDALGEVVEAGNRQEAIRLAAKHRPGLIVADLVEANASATMALVEDLASLRLDAPLVACTNDAASVIEWCGRARMVCTCVPRGRNSGARLSEAIAGVLPAYRHEHRAEAHASPAFAEPDAIASLTAREREILSMVAAGEPSRAIAQALHISLRTVESHRARVCAKLGVRTVAGLTKVAVNAGLTSLSEASIRRPV